MGRIKARCCSALPSLRVKGTSTVSIPAVSLFLSLHYWTRIIHHPTYCIFRPVRLIVSSQSTHQYPIFISRQSRILHSLIVTAPHSFRACTITLLSRTYLLICSSALLITCKFSPVVHVLQLLIWSLPSLWLNGSYCNAISLSELKGWHSWIPE